MTKPENFILTTDYATLKNDDRNDALSVTVPSSQTVGAGAVYSITDTVTVGSNVASIRSRMRSSKETNWYVTQSLHILRTGTVSGSPASYDVLAVVTRQTATTVRLTAFIRNPYGSTLTGASGSETFTAVVNTFLSPFV